MIVMTKQMKKSSKISKVNREFLASKPTDTVNNHKGIDLLNILNLSVTSLFFGFFFQFAIEM